MFNDQNITIRADKEIDVKGTFKLDGTAVTATAAELNALGADATDVATLVAIETELSSLAADETTLSALAGIEVAETIDSGEAIDPAVKVTKIDNTTTGAGAVTLAVPSAAMVGQVKVIEMTVDNGNVTLDISTTVQGGTSGSTCTFAAVGDTLILVGGVSKWNVIAEVGVVLS